jgi:hypothetical protein
LERHAGRNASSTPDEIISNVLDRPGESGDVARRATQVAPKYTIDLIDYIEIVSI